jgi:2-oxoglutarate ferredoxin oxidoreductase subunit alpha
VTTQLLASSVTIAIRGDGGEAVEHARAILARLASSASLEVLSERIRPAAFQQNAAAVRVRIGRAAPPSVWVPLDGLVGLPGAGNQFLGEILKRGAICLLDSRAPAPRGLDPRLHEIVRVPAEESSRAAADGATVELFVGALAGLLGFSEEFAASFGELRGASGEATGAMREAFERGLRLGNSAAPGRARAFSGSLVFRQSQLSSGAAALARGLVAGGARFFVGVPGAGVTELLDAVGEEISRRGLSPAAAVETADTADAAAAMAVGSSFGGVPAVWLTGASSLSRGGESLVFCGNSEVPLVAVAVQGAGPGGGLPPALDQGDLLSAIHGGPGQAPRAVFAPSDVRSAPWLARAAVRHTEESRIPTILLVDSPLLDRVESFDPGEAEAGHAVDRPSIGGNLVSGGERDADGRAVGPGETRASGLEKRWRRLEILRQRLESSNAMLGIAEDVSWEDYEAVALGWGSSAGAVAEGVSLALREGIRALAVHPRALHPLPHRLLVRIRERFDERHILVFEQNPMGDLARHLRAELGLKAQSHRGLDGWPLRPQEVLARLREVFAR